MARVAYRRVSGVVLDTCNAHGTWADGGELERILAFEAGSGPERLERREVDEARLQRERDIEARARWERVRSALRAW
jgi:Zn-finger nucleic acid-binding protein